MFSKLKNWIVGEAGKSLILDAERIHHKNMVALENKHKNEMERKIKEHENIIAGVRSAAQDYINARMKDIDSEKSDLEREKYRSQKIAEKYEYELHRLHENLEEIRDWKSRLGDFEKLIASLAIQYNESNALLANGKKTIENSLDSIRVSV